MNTTKGNVSNNPIFFTAEINLSDNIGRKKMKEKIKFDKTTTLASRSPIINPLNAGRKETKHNKTATN